MSWHWYASSALPRSLMAAFPLALAAPLLDRRAVPLLLIAAGFVALYSALPHKEVRCREAVHIFCCQNVFSFL